MTDDRKGIKSFETGAAVLSALADAGCALTARQLAERTGMTVNKLQFYLISLERVGFIRPDREPGRYDLGPAILSLGLAALTRNDLVESAAPYLQDLRDATGLAAYLTVWGNQGPTIVRWVDGRRHLMLTSRPGAVLPVLSSSAGRVFLAFGVGAGLDDIVAAEWEAKPRKPKPLAALVAEIRAQVRAAGVAITAGEIIPGVGAVAAPVLDHDGQLAGGLTVIGTDDQVDLAPDGVTSTLLKDAARRLSRELGYRPKAADPKPVMGAA